MKKQIIIDQFEQLRLLHQILGNIYETRAYEGVVKALEQYRCDEIKNASELIGLDGIGQRTLDKVAEILRTDGKLKILEELKSDPKIIARLELQKIVGIGPKMAKNLVEQRNIRSITDLKRKVSEGKITLTETQEIGLKYYRELNERIPRNEIEKFTQHLRKVLGKERKLILAGSYRRGKPTSGDIDLILVLPKEIRTEAELKRKAHFFDAIIEELKKAGIIIEILSRSINGVSAIVNTNFWKQDGMKKPKMRQMDLKLAPRDLVPFFLLYFGSGVQFSRWIRQIAKQKGMKLSEWGLNGIRKVKDEKEIFKKLGVDYVPPERR